VVTGDATPQGPTFNLIATVVQDLMLVLVALGFAATVRRPRPSHFGLRRTRFWRATGWTVLALATFYAFSAVYGILVQPEGEQSTLRDLGVDRSFLAFAAAAVLVIGLAPIAEEVFYRGFFYGALRTRFPTWLATTIAGLVFGALHYTGPQTLDLLPSLVVLGVLFCLLYEVTGSLWPSIALHTFNNGVAFALQTADAEVAGVVEPGLRFVTAAASAATGLAAL
jgi:uncharacterized protein